MRITGLGHAGLFVQTADASILCDPLVGPALFGSWFPFPDNRGLDWESFGRADFLYISHRRRDHLDPALLRRLVRRDIPVLLPDYPLDDLERDLRALGYDNIVHTQAGAPVRIGRTSVTITPLRANGAVPVGDASLAVTDPSGALLAQSASHPLHPAVLAQGAPDLFFAPFSGAGWWPMAYDLPPAARRNFARLARDAQVKRAMHDIDAVGAAHVFPIGGPPMLLRADLFGLNGDGRDDDSIFTDQFRFLDRLREMRPAQRAHRFMPGTRVDLDRGTVAISQTLYTDAEIDGLCARPWEYLAAQREGRQGEVAAEIARRAPVLAPERMLALIRSWWEPLLRRAHTIRTGVGGDVRFQIGALDMVVDFPRAQVRAYAGEECRYVYTLPADLVSTALADHEVDWANAILMSLQFEVSRSGRFNEFLTTFLACLSRDRIEYVENRYAEQSDVAASIQIDDWVLQRRCPHLCADLARTGEVADGVLTCTRHGWRWDLASGRCLTAPGHRIRAERIVETAHSR